MIANVDVNGAEIGQTLTRRVDITLFSQIIHRLFINLKMG